VGNETYLCYSLGGDVLRLLDKALSELKKMSSILELRQNE
jgi:hypothetical protein